MSISIALDSSSAIPNYAALKTEIGEWLDRDDLVSKIPVFVLMAEAHFNRELRTPDMERTLTFSVESEDTALPTDYLAMRAIYQETTPDNPLVGMSPDELRLEYRGQSGIPTSYAIVAGSIRVAPVPETALVFSMDYFAKIENLSDASPSNWLLESHPDLYLSTCLYLAESFLDNDAKAGKWLSLSTGILDRIKQTSTASRWGAGIRPVSARQASRARC